MNKPKCTSSQELFGVNASPYLAQLVSQNNAKINSGELPRAAETVFKSTHMDDSLDSVEDATKLHHDLTTLWNRAGMTPRKWLSNNEEVLKTIPKEHLVSNLDLDACHKNVGDFLGIKTRSHLYYIPRQMTYINTFRPFGISVSIYHQSTNDYTSHVVCGLHMR